MVYGTFAWRKGRVAPLAGARIEIRMVTLTLRLWIVAPLAGARIEMLRDVKKPITCNVAPLAGARIEILSLLSLSWTFRGRSPRGSAD